MNDWRERLEYCIDATRAYTYLWSLSLKRRLRSNRLRRYHYVLPSYLTSSRVPAWTPQQSRYSEPPVGLAISIVLVSLVLLGALISNHDTTQPDSATAAEPIASSGALPNVTLPNAILPPEPLLFGMGAQLEGSLRQRLYQEVSLDILTSWYNSPADLGFLQEWSDDIIPQTYATGKALHLIVWTDDHERYLNTAYGPACGRAYPLSAGFADDMKQLATTFNGDGTLYVSMFTEFQTYPCQDNMWQGSENYYRALQDQYRLAQSIFKTHAPNSQISLTWGGWQADWDDQDRGGGRSLLPYFADVMRNSDFQSFQAMDSRTNLQHIRDMTKLLGKYGQRGSNGDVMIAHYKPDNGSDAIWQSDLATIFTPDNIDQLRQDGLFAFSFMDEVNMNASEAQFQQAKQIVQTYSRP